MPDQNINSLLEQAHQLVGEGRTEEAIALLLTTNNSALKRRVRGISGRYKKLTKQHHNNFITFDQYNASLSKINSDLLAVDIDEPGSSNKKTLWAVLGIGVLVIAALLYFRFSGADASPEVEAAATLEEELKLSDDCQEHNRIIYIADFKNGDIDGFSRRLFGLVEDRVGGSYVVSNAPFLDPNQAGYSETILQQYYSNCDTSGIFVNGIIDHASSVLECVVNVINLDFDLGTENFKKYEKFRIRNPDELEFSVTNNARFVADFVSCLTKYYLYQVKEAVTCFNDLLRGPELESHPQLEGYIHFFMGNCHLMLGDEEAALRRYGFAKEKNPKLEDQVQDNEQLIAGRLREPIRVDFLRNLQDGIPKEKKKAVDATKIKQDTSTVAAKIEEDNSIVALDMSKVPEKRAAYGFKEMKDGKVWMTENLNINVPGCYCYNDNPKYCAEYGRLYTWEAAKEACALLGDGWRLPTDEEWKDLGMAYGGYYDLPNSKDIGDPQSAYHALLEGGSSGFAAQLGGLRGPNGNFYDEGNYGYYWSSTPLGSSTAWRYYFDSRAVSWTVTTTTGLTVILFVAYRALSNSVILLFCAKQR